MKTELIGGEAAHWSCTFQPTVTSFNVTAAAIVGAVVGVFVASHRAPGVGGGTAAFGGELPFGL